jgi:hypothetical protein
VSRIFIDHGLGSCGGGSEGAFGAVGGSDETCGTIIVDSPVDSSCAALRGAIIVSMDPEEGGGVGACGAGGTGCGE